MSEKLEVINEELSDSKEESGILYKGKKLEALEEEMEELEREMGHLSDEMGVFTGELLELKDA